MSAEQGTSSAAKPVGRRRRIICSLPPCNAEEARDQVLFNEDIMKLVFEALPLKDQNNFRLVCDKWYEFAHSCSGSNVYTVGKHPGVSGMRVIFRDIKERPLLKTFICKLEDQEMVGDIIDHLLKCVEDLHYIEVQEISPMYIRAIVGKYKNLRGVSLSESSRSILESVKVLRQCRELEKLDFTPMRRKRNHEDNIAEICGLIGAGFKKLKHIGFFSVYSHNIAEAVEWALRRKCSNLKSLRLVLRRYTSEIFNAIYLCSELTNLDLELYSPSVHFTLSNFPRLKTLKLTFREDYHKKVVTQTLSSNVLKYNLQNLDKFILELCDQDYNLGMLEVIATNLKNLKKLRLIGVDKKIMDSQLRYLRNFEDLHTLQINYCQFSVQGAQCISECKHLRSLKLIDCSYEPGATLRLIECSTLKKLQLFSPDIFS